MKIQTNNQNKRTSTLAGICYKIMLEGSFSYIYIYTSENTMVLLTEKNMDYSPASNDAMITPETNNLQTLNQFLKYLNKIPYIFK